MARLNSNCLMTISSACGKTCSKKPPAAATVPSGAICTPKPTADAVCSDSTKYSAISSPISPVTNSTVPEYGSPKPMSLMTVSVPLPIAGPTARLPSALRGTSTWGLATKPRTAPLASATTAKEPSGPSPLIRRVTLSFSFFKFCPKKTPAVSSRPKAAAPTLHASWRRRPSSQSWVVCANHSLTLPSSLTPRKQKSALLFTIVISSQSAKIAVKRHLSVKKPGQTSAPGLPLALLIQPRSQPSQQPLLRPCRQPCSAQPSARQRPYRGP